MAHRRTKLTEQEKKMFPADAVEAAEKLLETAPEMTYERGERVGDGKVLEEQKPEPKPEEKPAPEPEQKPAEPANEDGEVEIDQPETGNKVKMVRHEALHEERTKRKAAEEARKKDAEEIAELKRQMAALAQPSPVEPQIEQPKPTAPDLEKDPVGFIQQLYKEVTETKQSVEQDRAMQNFTRSVQQSEAAFMRENTDYSQAVNFLAQNRAQELAAMGMNTQQITSQIRNETQQIAAYAMSNRQDPAKVAYEMAKARGYRKPEPQPEAQPDRALEERMQTQARAGKSLSNNSGSALKGEIDYATFMKMGPAEISERFDNDPAFRKKFAGAYK